MRGWPKPDPVVVDVKTDAALSRRNGDLNGHRLRMLSGISQEFACCRKEQAVVNSRCCRIHIDSN